MQIKKLVAALAVVGVVMFVAQVSHAAVFVYEGFDYGGSNLGSLVSQGGGSSVGFGSNTWAMGLGADTSGYLASGLTFSNLVVTGGTGTLSSPAFTVAGRRTVSRRLGITQTGDVYGGFLLRSSDNGGQPGAALIVDNTAGPMDQHGHFAAHTTRDGVAVGKALVNDNAGTDVNLTGTAISANTTYLHLFKINALGSSGSHTFENWILTEAQFDNFKTGGLTEAELNAASTGTAASQVLQKGFVTESFTPTMTTTDYVAFNAVGATSAPFQFDEIRFSNVSLNEVVPIPEPATLALVAAGLGGLRRRRRT